MKKFLLAAMGFLIVGCRTIETTDPIAPTPVRLRITQRSLDEIRDTLPAHLVPEGGSYIAFEPDIPESASHPIRADQLRLVIESSALNLEPGEECSVTVALEGGAAGASYRVTLLVPDELTIRGPTTFVLEPGERRVLQVVSHARTTAKIMAKIQRISERYR